MIKESEYRIWLNRKDERTFRKYSTLVLTPVDNEFLVGAVHQQDILNGFRNNLPLAEIKVILRFNDQKRLWGAVLANRFAFNSDLAFVPGLGDYELFLGRRTNGDLRLVDLLGNSGQEMYRRVSMTYEQCLSQLNPYSRRENSEALIVFQNLTKSMRDLGKQLVSR